MSASVTMEVNDSFNISHSPSFFELMSLTYGEMITLLDNMFFDIKMFKIQITTTHAYKDLGLIISNNICLYFDFK